MTDYNPDQHRDIFLNELKHCIKQGIEIDLPMHPPRNDGSHASRLFFTIDECNYSIDKGDFRQLYMEACGQIKGIPEDWVNAYYPHFKALAQLDSMPKNHAYRGVKRNAVWDCGR